MFDHCMYFNTTALARQLERRWVEAFEPFGLTPPQAFMLRAVLDRPAMSLTELAEQMSIAKSTATRTLDQLTDKGLVHRVVSQADGRGIELHPSKEALGLHADLNRASGTVTRALKDLLGEDAFRETVARVKAVRSALG